MRKGFSISAALPSDFASYDQPIQRKVIEARRSRYKRLFISRAGSGAVTLQPQVPNTSQFRHIDSRYRQIMD